MAQYQSPAGFRHDDESSLGILLVNLGTPDAPTTGAVRRYLAEFLSDPRVVEVPRPIWWLILNLYILRVRPAESAKAYQAIWTPNGSPLLLHSQALADALQQELRSTLSEKVHVELGMSYGSPSLQGALEKLYEKGAQRIILLPLYPQYSGTTTASVFEAVIRLLSKRRWIPEFRFVNHYHDRADYIDAIAASVEQHWKHQGRGRRLLFSFHGLPRKLLLAGDPYYCHCQKTARLVAEKLGLADEDWAVSFQSRVGREEWLRPYTDELLESWGQENLGDIDAICPGFAADCLETLEEVALRYGELYAEAGGGKLRYIPALNSGKAHAGLLAALVRDHAGGWPEAAETGAPTETGETLAATLRRAMELGAER
jgi:ferrochelatase